MKVLTIMNDGFEELEAIGTIALLRRSGIEVCLATVDSTQVSGRFTITLDQLVPLTSVDATSYDVLFLPGGPHYQSLQNNEFILSIIHDFMKKDKVVAAICAAPTILGNCGLLKGRKYTCFTSMNADFGGTYIDAYTCVDGNLITGRSAAATIDFAFEMIKKLQGETQATTIKNQIYYDR